MPPQSSAAVISRGTTPAQQTTCGSLADIAGKADAAHLHARSMIIIGECVRQRETISWFEKKPLFGKRILVPRPAAQAATVVSRLLELGAQPVLAPMIDIPPPETGTDAGRI